MRALYFGTYERDYPRNSQVISSLRKAGVQVLERNVPLWENTRHKLSFGPGRLAQALAAQTKLALTAVPETDVVIVGYPGHIDMLAAKRVARGRPVVFNPLVSLEDTMVADRQLVGRRSLTARSMRLVDRRAFRNADLVVADTAAHARYFMDRFDLSSDRVAVAFVGAEDDLFRPCDRSKSKFHVLFVGKLIPLHGLETILEAASLCPEVEVRLVGSGQLDHLLSELPANVRWEPWVEYERLPERYHAAGCALGIFGLSDKTGRVIPNKAYHALATGTPLITGDTPAARELLVDGESALLVSPGDPVALATAIRRIGHDAELARRLGEAGLDVYRQRASETVLGGHWRKLLEGVVGA
jgi:glycosyltransferase involved in cell wall biosynthesis